MSKNDTKYIVKFDLNSGDIQNENLLEEYEEVCDEAKATTFDLNGEEENDLLCTTTATTTATTPSSDNDYDSNTDAGRKRKLHRNSTGLQLNGKKKRSSLHKSHSSSQIDSFEDKELVELDSTCLAFLPQNGRIPDIPYARYDCTIQATILPIKSRIVTYCEMFIYEQENRKPLINNESLSSATIAELPSPRNQHRYLVFFDNGCASYIKPSLAFPIFNLFTLPFERLNFDHVRFLINCFDQYPERTMVNLKPHMEIDTYFNQKWYACKVEEVDGSLVKLDLKIGMFESYINRNGVGNESNKQRNSKSLRHSIWFYRGSFRLYPLYDRVITKILSHKANSSTDTTELSQFELYVKDKMEDSFVNAKASISIFASTLFPKTNNKTLVKRQTKTVKDRERDELKV